MTAFAPIAPMKAVEFVEAAGITDARRIIVDFAAAGLLKSYALMIETVQRDDERSQKRGAAVSSGLWQRIVVEGAVDDVWAGGTVRLTAGAPQVNITGISFGEKQLQRVIGQYLGGNAIPQAELRTGPKLAPDAREGMAAESIEPVRSRQRRVSSAPAAELEPVLVTVKQAMAMLGLGRTKVSELMKSGQLARRHIDGGVRIEVASIRALVGLAG